MTDRDGRTKRVTFYVNEEERQALKREADDAGKSLSGYVLQLVRRQRQLDAEEQLSEDLNVEQRLMEITQQAAEEIEDSVESVENATYDLRDLQARAGTYPLVNFRLLMRQHRPPETWVSEQFGWASRKLRVPLSEHDPFVDLGETEPPTEDDDAERENSDLNDRLGR